jgi:GT2 family glycosyltransferase
VTAAELSRHSGICAVVVTFHPPEALLENVERLTAQVAEVLIVDNTPDDSSRELLRRAQSQYQAGIVRNGKNLGIAAALNLGVRHAISGGYRWVATFDQDSTITPGFFQAMLAAYEACPFREQVPLVAPVLCVSNEDYAQAKIGAGAPSSTLTRTAMSSGSLIKTEIFQQAGFYDEGLEARLETNSGPPRVPIASPRGGAGPPGGRPAGHDQEPQPLAKVPHHAKPHHCLPALRFFLPALVFVRFRLDLP